MKKDLKGMTLRDKERYINKISKRYHASGKVKRGQILDVESHIEGFPNLETRTKITAFNYWDIRWERSYRRFSEEDKVRGNRCTTGVLPSFIKSL